MRQPWSASAYRASAGLELLAHVNAPGVALLYLDLSAVDQHHALHRRRGLHHVLRKAAWSKGGRCRWFRRAHRSHVIDIRGRSLRTPLRRSCAEDPPGDGAVVGAEEVLMPLVPSAWNSLVVACLSPARPATWPRLRRCETAIRRASPRERPHRSDPVRRRMRSLAA